MSNPAALLSNLLRAYREHEHAKAQILNHHRPALPALVENYEDVVDYRKSVEAHDAHARVLERAEQSAHECLCGAYKDAVSAWPLGAWLRIEDVGIKLGGYGGPAGRTPTIEVAPWSILVVAHSDEPPAEVVAALHRDGWPTWTVSYRLTFLKELGPREAFEVTQ